MLRAILKVCSLPIVIVVVRPDNGHHHQCHRRGSLAWSRSTPEHDALSESEPYACLACGKRAKRAAKKLSVLSAPSSRLCAC